MRFFKAPAAANLPSVPWPKEAPVIRVICMSSPIARSANAGNTSLLSPALVKPLEPTTMPFSNNCAASAAVMTLSKRDATLIRSGDMMFLFNLLITYNLTIQFLSYFNLIKRKHIS